jgi:hypothetical protein
MFDSWCSLTGLVNGIATYISGSACSTVGVHSQAWSTSGIGRMAARVVEVRLLLRYWRRYYHYHYSLSSAPSPAPILVYLKKKKKKKKTVANDYRFQTESVHLPNLIQHRVTRPRTKTHPQEPAETHRARPPPRQSGSEAFPKQGI